MALTVTEKTCAFVSPFFRGMLKSYFVCNALRFIRNGVSKLRFFLHAEIKKNLSKGGGFCTAKCGYAKVLNINSLDGVIANTFLACTLASQLKSSNRKFNY